MLHDQKSNDDEKIQKKLINHWNRSIGSTIYKFSVQYI